MGGWRGLVSTVCKKLRKECFYFYIYFSPLGFAQALHCNQKASHAVLGTQLLRLWHPFPFAHGETSALITHLSPAGAVKVKEGSAKIFTSCSGRSFLVAILPMRMMVRIPLMTLPMTQNFPSRYGNSLRVI